MATFPSPTLSSPLKPMKTSTSPIPKLLHPRSLNFVLKLDNFKRSSSLGPLNSESSSPNSSDKPLDTEPSGPDPVKLAFAKAKAYKKAVESDPSPKILPNPIEEIRGEDGKVEDLRILKGKDAGKNEEEVSSSVKLAFEKAKKYRKKINLDADESLNRNEQSLGSTFGNKKNTGNSLFRNDINKKEELKVSSMDFVGLEFSEKKKSKGLPAGLVPQFDLFPEGDLPEVEILVGDSSKFRDGEGVSNIIEVPADDSDLYKPKVSTWGIFPRPNDISKTYGGGRTIQPGEVLETAEDRAAKEARTRKLLADYNSKLGLSIHPKLKLECQQAMKDGDSLMDIGKVKEALPFYEKVMEKLTFQTKLHGLAALKWSICLDTLTRANEARIMYEKLQAHPDAHVSKKARQMLFGFQAMEMMKVSGSKLSPADTGYQSYFEAFVKEETKYSPEEGKVDEGAWKQAIPYMVFLLSPILIVVIMVFQKGP